MLICHDYYIIIVTFFAFFKNFCYNKYRKNIERGDTKLGKLTMSDMYCTQCGKKNIPIQRKKGKERECGHLKKMYCIYCQKDVNMVEIRGFGSYTLDDFLLEYEYHNFNKDGTRKLEWGQFRTHINNGGGILE